MPLPENFLTENDATAQGTQLAAEWHGGVGSLVRLCVGIRIGFTAFEKEKALLDAFLAPLVEAGVFTADEATLGRSASKVSMLCQIGEHEQLLQRHEVARHLMAGYTLVYQACVIFKLLSGDEAQKIEQLSRILAACPEDRAREYLLAETRRLKRPKPATADQGNGAPQAANDVAEVPTLRRLIEAQNRFDTIVVTPGRDLRLLDEDYPDEVEQDESTLERFLPVHRVVDSDAVIVIAAPHRDFPIVANKLLDLCGFSRPSHVLLTRPATSRNITGAEVIIIAARGNSRIDLPDDAWGDEEAALNPLEVATQLCPDAVRRLHLFAPAETQGWCCVLGDNVWLERPSVR